MATRSKPARAGRSVGDRLVAELPTGRLERAAKGLLIALAERAADAVAARVDREVRKLVERAERGGPLAKAALAGARALAEGRSPAGAIWKASMAGLKEFIAGIFRGGKKAGVTNIVEQIDVGVPARVAYGQWTQFQEFPAFMKKVNGVDQVEDHKVRWTAQIVWSRRRWESTIIEQIPDSRIIWRSTGPKGHVDGAVTFHELAPNLTRILLVLSYRSGGLFERVGNIWRAQGRRARLELKHAGRHIMTRTILGPGDVEGWRGEIRDGRVVKTHDDALAEEARKQPVSQKG